MCIFGYKQVEIYEIQAKKVSGLKKDCDFLIIIIINYRLSRLIHSKLQLLGSHFELNRRHRTILSRYNALHNMPLKLYFFNERKKMALTLIQVVERLHRI